MRVFAMILAAALIASTPAYADPSHASVLDDTSDLFGSVTPDRLLGTTTRRKWLDLYPVDATVYWAAWDCKGKPCDTPARVHIRAIAKLVPRTSHDPKPASSAGDSSSR